jgi:hypothetical protein
MNALLHSLITFLSEAIYTITILQLGIRNADMNDIGEHYVHSFGSKYLLSFAPNDG